MRIAAAGVADGELDLAVAAVGAEQAHAEGVVDGAGAGDDAGKGAAANNDAGSAAELAPRVAVTEDAGFVHYNCDTRWKHGIGLLDGAAEGAAIDVQRALGVEVVALGSH